MEAVDMNSNEQRIYLEYNKNQESTSDKETNLKDFLKLSREGKKKHLRMIITSPESLLTTNKYMDAKPELNKIVKRVGFKTFFDSNFPILDSIMKDQLDSKDNVPNVLENSVTPHSIGNNLVTPHSLANNAWSELGNDWDRNCPTGVGETLPIFVNVQKKRKFKIDLTDFESIYIKKEPRENHVDCAGTSGVNETALEFGHQKAKKIKTEAESANFPSVVIKEELSFEKIGEDQLTIPTVDPYSQEKREYLLTNTVGCLKVFFNDFDISQAYELFLEQCKIHSIKGIDFSVHPTNDIWESNLKWFAATIMQRRAGHFNSETHLNMNIPLIDFVKSLTFEDIGSF